MARAASHLAARTALAPKSHRPPSAVAAAVRQGMAAASGEVVRDPAVRARVLEPQAYEAIGNTPEEFAAVLMAERERGAALARLAGF